LYFSSSNIYSLKKVLSHTFLVALSVIPSFCIGASAEDIAKEEFLRQEERERLLREQQEQTPDVILKPPVPIKEVGKLPLSEYPCFKIKQIILVGDNAKKFRWALNAANKTEAGKKDPAINRCLGTKGINLVMRRIQNAIIKRGYVTTRIIAEPQALSQEILKLTVIPGRISDIRFISKPQAYYGTIWNAVPVNKGAILNLRDVEQALENFKRLPTAETDIQIVPAIPTDNKPEVYPGESDLVINRKQRFPFRLGLAADDSGTRATGKYLGNLTLSCYGWMLLNDLFYYNYNHDIGDGNPEAFGTNTHTFHYSVPYGYWLLGFTHSNGNYYQTAAGRIVDTIYKGKSQSSELRLSRIIYRDTVRKIKLWLSGWSRNYRNFYTLKFKTGAEQTGEMPNRLRMAGWEVGINHREFIGPSVFDINVSYKQGTGALNELKVSNERGSSRPQIILANAQLNIPFALGKQRLRYIAECRTQWNQTPLIQQDRFSIGGRNTVRGFDGERLLAAERGWLIRNDLGFALGNTKQELYVGIDHGEINGRGSEDWEDPRLTGGVIGLRGSILWFTYDVFAGLPLIKPQGFNTASKLAGFSVNFSV
jgi:hemolysin activation/secretion protein